jgi:hypothetical protein
MTCCSWSLFPFLKRWRWIDFSPSVLDHTEAGRKWKGVLGDTSQFMGEKSRQADKVLGQATNAILTSVIGKI